MSFYLNYRPQVISDLSGSTTKELLNSLLNKPLDKLPHSFLLTGPKGIGKTTTARLISKLFNCTNLSKTNGPCGKCDSCNEISKSRNLNVIEIDAASNRGIDEMRLLKENIGFVPLGSGYKIYIIDEVHMLTTEAFNALLKTLEEPPQKTVFVLATTEFYKIPETIKSRCLVINFQKANTNDIKDALNPIINKEKITITDDAIERITKIADGSFRDAVKILEQLSLNNKNINLEAVEKTLYLSEEQNLDKMFELLSKYDTAKSLEFASKMSESGVNIKNFFIEFLDYLSNKLFITSKRSENKLDIREIAKMLEIFSSSAKELRSAPISLIPLQIAIVTYCDITDKTKLVSSTESSNSIEKKPIKEEKIIGDNNSTNTNKIQNNTLGLINTELLLSNWPDVINAIKPYNNSLSGFLRSSRPKTVENGIVTLEAFYSLHKDKLCEIKSQELISKVLKELFGENVKINVVLGKK